MGVPGRTLVIGSTGPMGREVLKRAADVGATVRAFARTPAALDGVTDDVAQGNVLDGDSLLAALDGVDAVISVLGSRPGRGDKHLLEEGTRAVVEAMRRSGCRRLVCVTGMGAGSSRGHGPLWYDALVRPTILRGVYADKERQEKVIETSGLDWTIVRPAVLVAKPQDRPVKAAVELGRTEKMGPLTRADVAAFLLDDVASRDHVGAVVHLYT
ncbi:NAD(P)H-binding protein [Millisia brevis]|uniref:NAD(P)H-binding protein n=1 Tax=Millisia brevis TaxID=264148 RepID=UPI001471DC64|nr:NAD(P)H-binding protein [Millisia brevis]